MATRKPLVLGAKSAQELANTDFLFGSTPAVGDNSTAYATTAFVRSALPINVKAYGAKGDGVTDDTTAINNAENAITAAGGILYFPNGTYIHSGLTKQSNTIWQGENRSTTILKLKAGVTGDSILGANFATLTGGVSSGGPRFWGLRGLTIDGNRANATGGYGVRVYGCTFFVQDIVIRNCAGDGLYLDYGFQSEFTGSTEPVQGYVSDFSIYGNGGIGLRVLGPHDTIISHGTVHQSDGSCEIWLGAGGLQVSKVHAYGQTNNIPTSAAWKVYGTKAVLTNVVGEGGFGCQFLIAASACTISGFQAYDGYNASGSAFYGVQLGDGTNYVANCNVTGGWIQGCNSGAVRLLSDDGNNCIQAICDQNSGVLYTGSITAGTELDLKPSSRMPSTGAATDSGRFLLSRRSFNALTLNDGQYNDVFNINTISKRFELPNGGNFRGYSDAYGTQTYNLNGANGQLSGVLVGAKTTQSITAQSPTINVGIYGTVVLTTTLTAAITGAVLQAGTIGGQMLALINNSAYPITFAATSSNVATGASVAIPANSAKNFQWDDTSGLWWTDTSIGAFASLSVSTSFTYGLNTRATDLPFNINAAAGTNRTVVYQTAGLNRFSHGVTGTGETGNQNGSNWVLSRWNDDGSFGADILLIYRDSGYIQVNANIGVQSIFATSVSTNTAAIGDNSTLAATTEFVNRAVDGMATFNTTGGTTTLGVAQYSAAVLMVTGALTSNAVLIVPNSGIMTIINRTTGTFTLVIKTVSGTGTAVTQNYARNLIADGTNVVPAQSDFPTLVPFDDPNNAAGLGTPALLRGTVNAELSAGLTIGSGLTLAARQANLAALQKAINYASANNKYFELAPGIYEISGAAGLTIPAVDGFSWQGTKQTTIKQCLNNAPILSVGDVSSGTINTQDIHISGVRLYYLNDQTGQANSAALKIGLVRNSVFENINIFAPYSATGPLQKAYRGIHVVSTGTNFGFFSNSLRDIFVGGADQCLMDVALVGTGSVFQNIYLTQGTTNNVATMSGPALRFLGNADQYETVLDQVNVEWVSANQIIFAQNLRGMTFLSCHFEGNQITGFDPCLFNLSTSEISLVGCNILDQVCLSGVTGTASLFRCYGDNTVTGSNLRISWSGASRVTTPLNLFALNGSSPGDANQSADITGLSFKDVTGGNLTNLQFSANMPLASFPPPYAVNRYQYGGVATDQTDRVVIQLPGTANYTHYQTHTDATVMMPAALAANRTITLSPLRKPSGVGSTLNGLSGNTIKIRRMSGTASSSLLVVNGGTAAGTLTTNTTAGTDLYYKFDGTNWAAYT